MFVIYAEHRIKALVRERQRAVISVGHTRGAKGWRRAKSGPCCSNRLHVIREDRAEPLDIIPASSKRYSSAVMAEGSTGCRSPPSAASGRPGFRQSR